MALNVWNQKRNFGFAQKLIFFLFHKCWQMLHEWDRVDEQILEWTLTRVRLRLRDFQWNRDFNMCVFAFQFKMTTSVKWLNISNKMRYFQYQIVFDKNLFALIISFNDFSFLFKQAIFYEGQDKNPEMCRVLLTHEIMCR